MAGYRKCNTFSCVPSPDGLMSRSAVWQAKPNAQKRRADMTEPKAKSRKKALMRTVRMSEEEFELFSGFCASQGLTTSEALRRLARSAALLGPTLTGEARAEIVALTRQMRAIGTNLNQAVHRMNAGHMVPEDEMTRYLDGVHGRSWSLIGCIAPCAPEPINAPCRQLRGLSHDGPFQLRHNVFARAVAPLAPGGGLCRTPGDHRGGGVHGLRVSGGGLRPPCPARFAGPLFGRRRFTKRPALHGRRAALAGARIDARRGRMGDAEAGRRRGWRRPSRRFLASFSQPLGARGARPPRGRDGAVRRRRAPIAGIEKGRACRRFTSGRGQTREVRRRS